MPVYRYTLYEPTEKTLKRIKEVQFYLFVTSFFYRYNNNNMYIIDLIESLASLYNCKPSLINILIDNFKSPIYKPTKQELAVAAFHLGIPIRELSQLAKMGTGTYYSHLSAYIKEEQPELLPRLSEELTVQLERFLSNASIMFNDVSNSLKGMGIYVKY